MGGAWEGFTKEVSITDIESGGLRESECLASEMESVSAIRAVMTGKHMRKPENKTTRAAEKEPRERRITREGRCELNQE